MNFHQFVEEYGTKITIPRGGHIFMAGDESDFLYVVQTGLLKAYYISEEGKESVKSFLTPGDVIGSLTAIYSKQKCSFSLLCLHDATLIRIPFSTLYDHTQDDPEIARSVVSILLEFAMKKERREFELLCLPAQERYTLLLERSPNITKHVTQNDIARYLGITPVALSRIKKRIS